MRRTPGPPSWLAPRSSLRLPPCCGRAAHPPTPWPWRPPALPSPPTAAAGEAAAEAVAQVAERSTQPQTPRELRVRPQAGVAFFVEGQNVSLHPPSSAKEATIHSSSMCLDKNRPVWSSGCKNGAGTAFHDLRVAATAAAAAAAAAEKTDRHLGLLELMTKLSLPRAPPTRMIQHHRARRSLIGDWSTRSSWSPGCGVLRHGTCTDGKRAMAEQTWATKHGF